MTRILATRSVVVKMILASSIPHAGALKGVDARAIGSFASIGKKLVSRQNAATLQARGK